MNFENNIFSNRYHLKQINPNFNRLIEIIQSNYTPIQLLSNESFKLTEENSFEFLQTFNCSNENQQIDFLSKITNNQDLWTFLSINSASYACQTFLEELYQLTLNSLSIKQHLCTVDYYLSFILKFLSVLILAFHIEDILLILTISFDDNIRYATFKIISLLMNSTEIQTKYLNRICYESLYDFDTYYETIKSFTIESRIIYLTKEHINDLINGEIRNKEFEKKVIETIDELGGYVFIKMHRSPKDAYQNLSKEIDNQWSQIWTLKSDEDPRINFMKIQNLNQLKLLIKNSDRLREDLHENCSEGKLILRKWIDHFPNEYRCFVCHGKLNAISGQELNLKLKTFINSKTFQNIILSIPYSHGIVDCTIDMNTSQVQIIEINPFSKRASAGQFSWIIDKDILCNHFTKNGFVYVKI